MDVRLINPFVESVDRLFSTMVKLPVTMARPFVMDRAHALERVFDTAVVVEMAGGASGIVTVRMPRNLAVTLVVALTGEERVDSDADLADGMAEIANMIVGGAKQKFPGDLVRVSTPKVQRSHDVKYPKGITGLVIPFETGGGRMLLEAVFRSTAPPAAKADAKADAKGAAPAAPSAAPAATPAPAVAPPAAA